MAKLGKKKKGDFKIADLLKDGVEAVKARFSPRHNINKGKLPLPLSRIEDELRELRSKYGTPMLLEEHDILEGDVQIGDKSVSVTRSRYLELDRELSKAIEQDLSLLLSNYDLPESYYDWIESWFLYRKQPEWTALVDFELYDRISRDKSVLKDHPLTTGEKKFLTQIFRLEHKLKGGRPPKEMQGKYAEFTKLLKSSKNTKRRQRTLEETLIVE